MRRRAALLLLLACGFLYQLNLMRSFNFTTDGESTSVQRLHRSTNNNRLFPRLIHQTWKTKDEAKIAPDLRVI